MGGAVGFRLLRTFLTTSKYPQLLSLLKWVVQCGGSCSAVGRAAGARGGGAAAANGGGTDNFLITLARGPPELPQPQIDTPTLVGGPGERLGSSRARCPRVTPALARGQPRRLA